MQNNVFLIGFMGAGKSRLGKRLANRMNYSFLDADREIEKENNATIQQLFDSYGEFGFRELETQWLTRINTTNTIIALGGGTPCYNDNMSLILEKGKSIYLELSPKMLTDRLLNAKDIRPLIEPFKNDRTALLKFVKEKLEIRAPYYEQANYKTTAQSLSAARLDDLIQVIKKL